MFQRTPNWFFPKMDPVYPDWLKKIFRRVPFLMTLQRVFFFYMADQGDLDSLKSLPLDSKV